VTVKVYDYRGDGTYYLCDPARELDGLREGPPGRVLAGGAGGGVDDELRRALARDPPGRALDVVLAAPKPISVLLATEPPEHARRVVALQRRAVDEVVAYLVPGATVGRSDPTAVTAVAFTHGISRRLDPHLHTHVLLAPARGADLDRRGVHARAAAADALYLAALREGLPSACGRTAFLGRSGATLVEGVDHGLVAGASAPRSRSGAVERAGAKRHPTRDEVRAHWGRLVASSAEIGAPCAPTVDARWVDERRFALALGDGLVGHADVARAWAASCSRGEQPDRVVAAARLLAPELLGGARRPAVAVRDDVAVRHLGPRPRDPAALAEWCAGREALRRYLGAGHPLAHLADGRRATAAALLARARLDNELAARGLVVGREVPARARGLDRSLS
jgi:hypothetical protein